MVVMVVVVVVVTAVAIMIVILAVSMSMDGVVTMVVLMRLAGVVTMTVFMPIAGSVVTVPMFTRMAAVVAMVSMGVTWPVAVRMAILCPAVDGDLALEEPGIGGTRGPDAVPSPRPADQQQSSTRNLRPQFLGAQLLRTGGEAKG
ncbi:unnamed protein product [Spirodela intermedia]|uniref:Uncharacterized protein n=1 Tax=Spirodela intermedia TaxID=51605 RepID=A0A7I8LCD3_SPIIN|nr:unnamed protein product [Spirodela intermedia]